MHGNAVDKPRLGYAAPFGRGGSLARQMVKLLMAAWMMFGMATSVQAEGSVNQIREKTGFWAMYGANGANSTSTAAEVCLAWGRHLLGTTLVFYEFLGTEQNADYFASLGMLNCIFRDTTTGVIAPNGGIVPVTRGVCPANSTPGSPCTCNTNFKPDPTLTSCIPVVQYTIALHDLNVGGELAPDASRAAYAQVMEGAAAKSGIAVTLTITAPPEAGTAILSPTAGSTGGDGKLNFSFTAPPVGGTHTVTATCDGGKCSNQATETVVVTECTIPDLPPITDPEVQLFEDNPNRSDTDRLTPRMGMNPGPPQGALLCLSNAIRDADGTSTVGSAFRPPAYNQHLIAVWDKWRELRRETNPACQPLRSRVEAHFNRHGMVHRPAPNSRHTLGEAFDLTSSLPYATLDALAAGCQVYRNDPVGDRVHFIHR